VPDIAIEIDLEEIKNCPHVVQPLIEERYKRKQ